MFRTLEELIHDFPGPKLFQKGLPGKNFDLIFCLTWF